MEALQQNVRTYVDSLSHDAAFSALMNSKTKKDAITGNVMFDRFRAIRMITDAAKETGDVLMANAKAAEIYKCIVRIARRSKKAA